MKPSIFNFSYQRNKQEYVVYNTFSKAVIVLDESEYAKFNHIGHNHVVLDEEMYQILFENGLIISDGFCEIDYLRYFHYKTKFSNDELSLTIAPTLDCNFACPYCYENPRKGKMTEDIQEHLLAFIKQKERQGTKKLDITWYGGEPLLYPEIIDSLATKINEYGLKKEMYVGMSLVTNGYLVTPDIVEMLLKNRIHSVQITLDGLEKHHNKRRFLRNGEGTFNKIIGNLNYFNGTPIRINIRMNIDRFNYMDYPGLKKLIDSFDGFEIALYPSVLENLNERKLKRIKYYMNHRDYEDFIIDSHNSGGLEDGGLDIIDNRRYFCVAELENSYVVDEKGNFYKCWDDIGNEKSICFNIYDKDNIDFYQVAKYVGADPFTDPLCKKCKFLPLCFGGCKFQKNTMHKKVCNFSDESLRLFIENKYF